MYILKRVEKNFFATIKIVRLFLIKIGNYLGTYIIANYEMFIPKYIDCFCRWSFVNCVNFYVFKVFFININGIVLSNCVFHNLQLIALNISIWFFPFQFWYQTTGICNSLRFLEIFLTVPSCCMAEMYISSFSTFFLYLVTCSTSCGLTSLGHPPSVWFIPLTLVSNLSVLI